MTYAMAECAEFIAQKIFDRSTLYLREMRCRDVKEVAQLEQELFQTPWSCAAFREELDNKLSTIYVLLRSDRIIGYAIYWIVVDEVQIMKIALVPALRRLGIATWLLETIFQNARHSQAKKVFIEVRASNKNAVEFYKKNGFVVQGIRRNYYTAPTEDALCMRRDI